MSSPSSASGEKAADSQQTGGTPDEASLNVRFLENEWIVESNLGETVGKSADKDGAIALAREHSKGRSTGTIKILGRDGDLEQTIDG